MGVHGLWELLAPVGRRVSVETLAGKKLAIDASIWMIQFMKAMRDEKGEMVRNAHILGFFRRICKLLYLRTKPVFVFDGGTPALKRRTVIARRRQRENAQVKIRKTAEKLLLNHLKTMRLKELAENLKKQRQENDIKGKKQVEPETGNEAGKTEDGDGGVAASLSQEELDELLAASIAAEENEGLGMGASTSGAPDNKVLDEDDDEDEEMILPEMHGKVDPAVLAALPPSMQLDLLVQMRERLMAENRQKYQKVKKAPARFSELQIESYLKTVAFRREIDGVQKSAAGRGIDGVQTSRIASEANREFIFSSSFTGDKQALTSVGQERNGGDQSRPPPVDVSANAVNKGRLTKKADVAAGPAVAESGKAFDDDVETYLDERGRLRISKVRALGIRMTRDLQRNLDLMKEMDSENNEKENNENAATGNSSGVLDDSFESILGMEATDINYGMNTEVDIIREPVVLNGSSIEISFEAKPEPDEYGDHDDSLFASLVAGDPIRDFSVDNSMISEQSLHTASDNEWEEGVVKGKSTEYLNAEEGMNDEEEIEWEEGDESHKHVANGALEETSALQEVQRRGKEETMGDKFTDDFHQSHASEGKSAVHLNVGDTSDEGEVEWEEGSEDIMLKSVACPSENNSTVRKGALEEEASLQEAIRRSLEEKIGDKFMDDFHENHASEGKNPVHLNVGGMSNEEVVGREQGSEEIQLKSSSCLSESNTTVTKGALEEEASLQEAIRRSLDDISGRLSTTDHENTFSERNTSSFIEKSPERSNAEPKLLNQDAIESGALAGEVLLSTDILPGDDAKEQPLETHTEDSYGFPTKKLVDSCDENVGHDMSSSTFTGSSHKKLLDSSSADAKNTFQQESDPRYSTEARGKPIADDSTISFDDLAKDEITGSFSMDKEVERNSYQDQKILEDRLEGEMSYLGKEREELGNEQRRFERDAESVNNEMFTECQELLQMFGLPYIIAPMEAEAQCAFMELSNLVDGVVTEDSDAFLFGSQCVYKNIFDDRKYVETYLMKDIENELGLDREKLIHMALLLGSDYTEGISGVGIVNAIEVVNAFHGKDGLREFREWIESPDPSILGKLDAEAGGNSRKEGSKGTDDVERKKQIFKDKHRNVSKNWHVSSTFPSDAVISAYVSPQVDKSTEPFAWGKPDLFVLRKLCSEKFGWGSSKADELLLPVLKEYTKHETQLRLEAFYTFNERFAKIRSKRIEKAVKGITGSKSSAAMDETGQKSAKRGKKRKTKPQEDEGAPLEADLTAVDGAATSNQDNTTEKPSSQPLKKGETRKKNARRVTGESSGRGRGRGQRSGRGRKKADTVTSYDVDTGSENDEEMQFHTSEEAPQLRRSSRPRKTVNYEAPHEVENPEKEDAPFMEEVVPSEELHANLPSEELHANQETDDRVNEVDKLPLDEKEVIDDVHTEDPPHHDQDEPKDYLQFGGGFCMAEDEENDPNANPSSPIRETTLDNSADPMLEENQESNQPNIPRASNKDSGTPYNALYTNDFTSGNDEEDDPDNPSATSLRAMPNLRKKRRKD